MSDAILVQLASLKSFMGLSSSETSEDGVLSDILLSLDDVVANVTKRVGAPGFHPFESVESTEYYDGTGRDILALRRKPVTNVSKVYVDPSGAYGDGVNAFDAAVTEWTNGLDWVLPRREESEQNGSYLRSLRWYWPEGYGNIKVAYTAGYTRIPNDLQLAVKQLAVQIYQSKGKAGLIRSENLGKYSYELFDQTSDKFPAIGSIKSTLANYTDIVI